MAVILLVDYVAPVNYVMLFQYCLLHITLLCVVLKRGLCKQATQNMIKPEKCVKQSPSARLHRNLLTVEAALEVKEMILSRCLGQCSLGVKPAISSCQHLELRLQL